MPVPGPTLQNLVAQANWLQGFLHPWHKDVCGCGGIPPLILSMSITWVWVLIVRLGPLLRRNKFLCRHWIRDCVASRRRSEWFEAEKTPSHLPGIWQRLFSLPVTVLTELFLPLDMAPESRNGTYNFFFHGSPTPDRPRPPLYRSFTITLRHTAIGRTPLDEWSAWYRDLYLTWQHTTLTGDGHPCPLWDSNPQSQKASGRRSTP